MDYSRVILARISCGRCGRRPKAKSVETYGFVKADQKGVPNVHIPSIWSWRCPCGMHHEPHEADLKAKLARQQYVALGIDLG